MKLELNFRGGTEFEICKVDEDGNGIIVARGKLAGCDFLSEDEMAERKDVVSEMVALWNDFKGV